MKNLTISFLLLFFLLQYSTANGQADSLVDKTLFIIEQNSKPQKNIPLLGINIAPNHTFNLFVSDDGKAQLSAGFEGGLFFGIRTSRMQISLGIGYAFNNCKSIYKYSIGGGGGGNLATAYITHRYESTKYSLDLNWLSGDEKKWLIGTSLCYANIHYFEKFVHTTDNPNQVYPDYSIKYETPQSTYWLGLNFGRIFILNDSFEMSLIFNTKMSSYLYTKNNNYSTADPKVRTLFVKTININFAINI